MTTPLAKRLTIRIMAVVLVMMGVITGAVYYSVREYMVEEAQERYAGALLRNLEELRRRLSDVYVATHNNLHFIEQDVENPEKVTEHLRRMVSNNKSMVTCGVLYEPSHFTNKKRCPKPTLTTFAPLPRSGSCATSPTTPLPWWPRRRDSPACAPCNAGYKRPSA